VFQIFSDTFLVWPSLTLTFSPLLLWRYSPLNPGNLLSFLNLYTVGRAPWTGDQPVPRPLSTHRTTQTQTKRTQTSMPRVRFEPTTSAFEWAKMVHALDHAATVIGPSPSTSKICIAYSIRCYGVHNSIFHLEILIPYGILVCIIGKFCVWTF
jgi:hypothetical protein